MIARRDLLMAAACFAGAGAAYALTPRRHVNLLEGDHVDAIVPRVVAGWVSHDVSDLVAPKEEDSLASRLYGETVGRVYRHDGSGAEIMMLLAYGNTQTDDLQLHRPEVCYPAFGFAITQNHETAIPIIPGVAIPARGLVAVAPDRRETILYWSRLGEYFPTSRGQQHADRTRTSMEGVIADGLLARFSVATVEPAEALSTMFGFVPLLVKGTSAAHRAALIGTVFAKQMAAARA